MDGITEKTYDDDQLSKIDMKDDILKHMIDIGFELSFVKELSQHLQPDQFTDDLSVSDIIINIFNDLFKQYNPQNPSQLIKDFHIQPKYLNIIEDNWNQYLNGNDIYQLLSKDVDKFNDIVNFDDLRVTTLTDIIKFEPHIDLISVFALILLPISYIEKYLFDVKGTKNLLKNRKLLTDKPGTILSLRYGDNYRGLPRKQPFRNGITIDLSTSVKIVSIKLAPASIQIIGSNSKELSIEVYTHILNHLNYINLVVKTKKLLSNDELDQMITWLKQYSKGSIYRVIPGTNILNDDGEVVYSLRDPTTVHNQALEINKFDDIVFPFLLQKLTDFARYDMYCDFLDFFKTVDNVIDENASSDTSSMYDIVSDSSSDKKEVIDFKTPTNILISKKNNDTFNVTQHSTSMINYNYQLPFKINRLKLKKCIDNHEYTQYIEDKPFIAIFDQTIHNFVSLKLEFEYTQDDNISIKRRKNKKNNTFIIYESGNVTQSSPHQEIARCSYYYFQRVMRELAPYISKKSY